MILVRMRQGSILSHVSALYYCIYLISLDLVWAAKTLSEKRNNEFCDPSDSNADFTAKVNGSFTFADFQQIKLYDPRYCGQYCTLSSPNKFTSCTGPLGHLKIFTGLNIEESIEQSTMKFQVIEEDPSHGVHGYSQNQSSISQFTGHIFAVPNAYINRWGQTFDLHPQRNYRYLNGRCADLPEKPIYPIESLYRSELTMELNTTVINLVIPWSFVYGHELMEVLPTLIILKPFLDACPHHKLQLIGFHDKLTHAKLFPLLTAAQIDIKKVKFLGLYQKEIIIHAAWVLLPILPCLYIPQAFVKTLRRVILPTLIQQQQQQQQAASSPQLTSAIANKGHDIVLHDRRLQVPHRNVPEGPLIEQALLARYTNTNASSSLPGSKSKVKSINRRVIVISGKESLAQTIQIMQSASVFISVHSSATGNMMFMRANTTYIEISPRDYNFDCMLGMAYALGMYAYDYTALSGKWQTSAHVNLTVLLPKIFEIIDQQDARYLP